MFVMRMPAFDDCHPSASIVILSAAKDLVFDGKERYFTSFSMTYLDRHKIYRARRGKEIRGCKRAEPG